MGWLSKIFKGSVNRVSRGHYNGNSHEGYSTQHTKSYGAHGNEDEDMDHAIALSLSEEDQRKGKAIDAGHHLDEDEQLARALQENTGHDLDEDEQLARALQESMNDGPPRRDIPIEDVHSESAPASSLPSNIFPTSGLRVCAGCKSPIGRGRFLSCMDSVWHPECFRCYACDRPISEYEFAVHENHAYHRPCYKECFHPKCDVCSSFIPTNKNGLIEYRAHPFWMQKYCPSHENDGTPRCCSCERMEPKDSQYITLDDGRRLCLECLHTAIMETNECQPLYIDIQEFYEGMNMKVEQQVPLLLVERQALNEAMEAEKSGGPDAKADPFAQRQEFRIGSPPDATPATTKPPDDLANPPPPDDIAKPAPPPRTDAVSATSQHLSSSASTSGRRRHRMGRCLMQRRAHHIEQQQLLQVLHPRSLLPPDPVTSSLLPTSRKSSTLPGPTFSNIEDTQR